MSDILNLSPHSGFYSFLWLFTVDPGFPLFYLLLSKLFSFFPFLFPPPFLLASEHVVVANSDQKQQGLHKSRIPMCVCMCVLQGTSRWQTLAKSSKFKLCKSSNKKALKGSDFITLIFFFSIFSQTPYSSASPGSYVVCMTDIRLCCTLCMACCLVIYTTKNKLYSRDLQEEGVHLEPQ